MLTDDDEKVSPNIITSDMYLRTLLHDPCAFLSNFKRCERRRLHVSAGMGL